MGHYSDFYDRQAEIEQKRKEHARKTRVNRYKQQLREKKLEEVLADMFYEITHRY